MRRAAEIREGSRKSKGGDECNRQMGHGELER